MSIVVLRAKTKVAVKHGLNVSSIKVNDNCYATGQTIIPGRKETIDFLTLEKARGNVQLSADEMIRFPFIINPDKNYSFKDNDKFDTNTPEGKAFVDFIKLCASLVANDKDEFKEGKHHFYLENKEIEAAASINNFEKIINAANIIKEMSPSDMKAFLSFIKIYKDDFSINDDMSSNLMTNTLNKYAQKEPELIIKFTNKEMNAYIKVSEFVVKGILRKTTKGYFEQNSFLSSDLNGLSLLYRNDFEKAQRWDKRLSDKVGNNIEYKKVELSESQKLVELLKESISKMDFEEANNSVNKLEEINDSIAKDAFKKYSVAISKIKSYMLKTDNNKNQKNYTVETLIEAIEKKQIDFNTVKSEYFKITKSDKGSNSLDGYLKKLNYLKNNKEEVI